LSLPISSTCQQQYEPFKIKPIGSPLIKKDTAKKKNCEIKDIGDVFRELFHNNKHKKSKIPPSEKKVSMLILPNISYNPANGLLLGVGGNVTMYLGSRKNTRISAAGFTGAYTTENQIISFIKSNLFTAENKFFFSGDWRYYKYSESTFGLGTNAPDSLYINPSWGWQGTEVGDGEGYTMRYNYVIFHEIANMKVVDNFYLGVGYQLDYYWNIKDQKLNLDSIPIELTPHWSYSKYHGFDTASYMLSGVSLNVLYDSRDNQICAYTGIYAKLNYRMNPTFFGSSENSTELWLEFRTYLGLSKKIPRHLIAFWFFGNFLVSGNQPYLTLMGLGDDKKGRSGRGYTTGRFRGQDYLYTEVEYRFPLMRCAQTLGGVIFVNASTASNRDRDVKLFNYIRPAVGFGLRILTNKQTRMNIDIDFGIGFQSKGIYFGGTEVF
jgi:outer membrane protein assembly factor BamA